MSLFLYSMVKMKHVILGIAIALISVFFFAYAVQAVYPGPEWDDFCDNDLNRVNFDSQAECEAVGGKWTAPDGVDLSDSEARAPKIVEGYCNPTYECYNEYNEVREVYERNVFFANLIIGIVVLVGAFFLALEAVSAGLMGGAIMLIVYATIRYWGNLSDIWRTLILGLSLVILIGLAYKKLTD